MKYKIFGGSRLVGEMPVYSAKNCLLVLLAASLLTKDAMLFKNCTKIADVDVMIEILEHMGAKVCFDGKNLSVDSSNVHTTEIPEQLSGKMRGSIFLLGALLGRFKKATAFTPGGCAIGKRPIDIHIDGLKCLGVEVREQDNKICCDAKNAKGSHVNFRFASVGATENLLMCAVLTRGTTVLHNCACEPEVEALANCLVKMGAKISGIGKPTMVVCGVKSLHGTEFEPIADRIVAGTYLVSGAVTNGDISVSNCNPKHIESLLRVLAKSGCQLTIFENAVKLKAPKRLLPFSVKTEVFPGFPTDLQSLVLSAAAVAKGRSTICESIFENRLQNNATELKKMGAEISVQGNTATVVGVKKLHGAEVVCKDLRGGAGLVLAALTAEGQSVVSDIFHIERGYSNLHECLNSVGASIVLI